MRELIVILICMLVVAVILAFLAVKYLPPDNTGPR
jgi:hypothetical protein